MNENVDYGEKGCYWEIANKSVMIGECASVRVTFMESTVLKVRLASNEVWRKPAGIY